MPSNDERREVAARLRELARENKGPVIGNLAQALGLGTANCFRTNSAIWEALADLIEPEPERTCEFARDKESYPTCSACGYEAHPSECEVWTDGRFLYERNFCPACGARAKVVD